MEYYLEYVCCLFDDDQAFPLKQQFFLVLFLFPSFE